MQFLLLLSGFFGVLISDLFVETVAEKSANLYYDGWGSFFWDVPTLSAGQLQYLAITGPEIEYLEQICSVPFL